MELEGLIRIRFEYHISVPNNYGSEGHKAVPVYANASKS